jgi:hypothetical protein
LQSEPPVVTEQDIRAARAACNAKKTKKRRRAGASPHHQMGQPKQLCNIAGSLHYVLALLGSVDDRS